MKKLILLWISGFSILLSGCGWQPSSDESENADPPSTDIEDEDEVVEPEEETVISFFAVGDNLIHDQILDYAEFADGEFDFTPIYENFADDIANTDLSYINQESIIGGDELGFSGYPAFNTPSAMAENLVDLGFNVVTGSNNHTLDKGTRGVLDTVEIWADYQDDTLFTGVFDSQEMRDEIPVIEVDGMSFSVLTYTYGTNGIEPEEPYFLNYFDRELITNDVKRAQELSDFVIVAAHWGDEHTFEANEMQQEYAQLFADLDVDLVVGNHSHTIQPIEWITGEDGDETLVIYSLGNFLAATTSDINLLGGSVSLNFVEDEDGSSYIDNVAFEPHVIHYEEGVSGDIETRTDFKLYKLDEYPDELAAQHALNNFEDNVISVENYWNIVDDVIDDEFLK